MTSELLVICISAFIAVFILLSLLAVAMRLLIITCPVKVTAGPDAAMLAAVTTAVTVAYPGTKVTKVEMTR